MEEGFPKDPHRLAQLLEEATASAFEAGGEAPHLRD
jgi:hypothetical protein